MVLFIVLVPRSRRPRARKHAQSCEHFQAVFCAEDVHEIAHTRCENIEEIQKGGWIEP